MWNAAGWQSEVSPSVGLSDMATITHPVAVSPAARMTSASHPEFLFVASFEQTGVQYY